MSVVRASDRERLPSLFRRFGNRVICTGCNRQWRISDRGLSENSVSYLRKHQRRCVAQQRRRADPWRLDPEYQHLKAVYADLHSQKK